jgi:predicted transcriptional regulator
MLLMVSALSGLTMNQGKAITCILGQRKAIIDSFRSIGCLLTSINTFRGGLMKTVTLDVRSRAEVLADVGKVWKSGKAQKTARISFSTPELLWKVLTAKRWELLKALCGSGPVSIREAARRVNRDVKAVHADVTALLNAGVLDRAEQGGIVFPYEAVKVEFLLQAA